MALSGTLQTLSVAEIFQTLSRTNASGVLGLDALDMACDVIFDQGNVIQVYDRSPGYEVTLVERLIAWGAIQEEGMPGSRASSSGSWNSVQSMVDQGRADPEQIDAAIADLTLSQVYDLFTWEEASFTFTEEGQDSDADYLLANARQRPVTIGVDGILMESARRIDEWEHMRSQFPTDDAVFSPAEGGEAILEDGMNTYPARAVIPLIDGVRSLHELVSAAPATRLDVYSTLADLTERLAIVPLDAEQMKESGNYYRSIGDVTTANRLYRNALAADPGDQELRRNLAETLEMVGDSPEAAGCFRQLARAYLADDHLPMAMEAAQKAVRLAGRHSIRERAVLVDCHERIGDLEEARLERLRLGWLELELGQWNAAQRTGTELLQLDPTDVDACHLLARAIAMNDEFSCAEDDVVCIMCTTVNPRGRAACDHCGAPLMLPCVACNREIAVSDRVCLYCGSDPHMPDARGVGFGDDFGGGSDDQLDKRVREAAKLLDTGQGSKALKIWKELVEERPDDQRLKLRMREVAAQVHRQSVADQIELARHRHQKRRYFGAYRAYRAALTGMPDDDPRRPRLEELCREAGREMRRNGMIYATAAGAACIALALLGIQRWRAYSFKTFAESSLAEARELGNSGGFASFTRIRTIRLELSQRAIALGDEAIGQWEEIDEIINRARMRLIGNDLDEVEHLIGGGRLDRAQTLLDEVVKAYGPGIQRERQETLHAALAAARDQQSDIERRRRDDPKAIQRVRELQDEGRLADALAQVDQLLDSPVPEVVKEATTLQAALAKRRQAYDEQVAQFDRLITENYPAAMQQAQALLGQAGAWNEIDAVTAKQAQLQATITAAERAFKELEDDPSAAAAERFLLTYGGSRHAPRADALLRSAKERAERRNELMAAYTRAMDRQEWAHAHAHAVALNDVHRQAVPVPVLIETAVPGAQVALGGEVLGRTPLTVTQARNAAGEVVVSRPGSAAVSKRIDDLQRDWRWQLSLDREVAWTNKLGVPVHDLIPHGDGLLLLTSTGLIRLDQQGAVVWKQDIDDDGFADRPDWQQTLACDEDGQCLVISGTILSVITADGREIRHQDLGVPAIDAPILYTNDLFGPETRIALIGEDLVTGTLGAPLQRAQVSDRPVAGPLMIGDSINQAFVLGGLSGRIYAWDETGGKPAWPRPIDAEASHLDHLQLLRSDVLTVVADDSRLLAMTVDTTSARALWQVRIPGRLLAKPVIVDGAIELLTSTGVHRVTTSGQIHPVLEVPCVAAARGDMGTAIIAEDGQLSCYAADGTLRWSRALGLETHRISMIGNLVVTADEKGTMHAFIVE